MLIVALGSLIQGAVGFGVALVAAPFLILIDPGFLPGPMLFAAFFLGLIQFRRDCGAADRKVLGFALAGRIMGTFPALGVLTIVAAKTMSIVLGVLVLAAVALSAIGPRIRPTPRSLLAGGVLSGFMGTVSSIGGPAIALVYQHESGPRLRGSLGLFFAAGSVISMVSLAFIGRFGWDEIIAGLFLLPGIALGFVLSNTCARWLDRGSVRPAVLIGAAAAAVVAILQSLL